MLYAVFSEAEIKQLLPEKYTFISLSYSYKHVGVSNRRLKDVRFLCLKRLSLFISSQIDKYIYASSLHTTAPRSHITMPSMRWMGGPLGVILGHQNELDFIFLKRDILGAVFHKKTEFRTLFISELAEGLCQIPLLLSKSKVSSFQSALIANVIDK